MFKTNGNPNSNREKKVAYWLRRAERDRIVKILHDRYQDLNYCNKNDNCKDLARIVMTCIEDIEFKEQNG